MNRTAKIDDPRDARMVLQATDTRLQLEREGWSRLTHDRLCTLVNTGLIAQVELTRHLTGILRTHGEDIHQIHLELWYRQRSRTLPRDPETTHQEHQTK